MKGNFHTFPPADPCSPTAITNHRFHVPAIVALSMPEIQSDQWIMGRQVISQSAENGQQLGWCRCCRQNNDGGRRGLGNGQETARCPARFGGVGRILNEPPFVAAGLLRSIFEQIGFAIGGAELHSRISSRRGSYVEATIAYTDDLDRVANRKVPWRQCQSRWDSRQR